MSVWVRHVELTSKARERIVSRDGKLPYGTTALVVHSTQIVQTIYGSIQEYGGFEWLD